MRYCQEKGRVCQYAGSNMHCCLTACVFPRESVYPVTGGGHLIDIEKLIEQLNGYFDGKTLTRGAALDAATALSTLQAKNSQLRESRDHWKRLAHELSEGVNGKDAEHERLQAENEKLRAELKGKVDLVFQQAKELDRRNLLLQEQESELAQLKQKYDEAREAICTHCMDIPCREESCYWWRGHKED